MAGKRTVSTRPHMRNGRPVRGYTSRRSMSDTLLEMIRGERPGSGRKIAAYAAVFAASTVIWWTFSLTLSAVHTTLMTLGVVLGTLAVMTGIKFRQSRRRRRSRSILWDPRARWQKWSQRYRRVVPSLENRRRWAATRHTQAVYDRFRGTYEVTVTRRKGGKTVAETKRFVGLTAAEDAAATAQANGWKVKRERNGAGWRLV